ncbi:unnamed protein product, partial [Ilex paraguariensis]
MGSRKRTTGASPSGGERQKKQKNDARMKSVKEKNMTCKWHADRPTLGLNDEVVRVIEGHGFDVWFKLIGGYVMGTLERIQEPIGKLIEDSQQ